MSRGRPRVLFVTRSWPPAVGGMETYCLELTRAMSELCEVEVIHPPPDRGAKVGKVPGVARFFLQALRQVWRRAPGSDVVHLGDLVLWPVSRVVRMRARNARIACTVHGLDLLYGRRRELLAKLYVLYLAIARRFHFIDVFVANSRNTARLAEKAGFVPVEPVRLGVRSDFDAARLADEAAAGTNASTILFVGRLVERKGAAWFAEKVMQCLDAEVRFVVVGSGINGEQVRRLQGLKNVEYHGVVAREELDRLRREAVVQVMPNRPSESTGDVEGFGLVAVEAGSQGIPVVASNVEGIPDAIVEGVTGFLVDPDDVDGWRDAIERILRWSEEERDEFSRQCVECVAREYSWERVARETLNAYWAGTATRRSSTEQDHDAETD